MAPAVKTITTVEELKEVPVNGEVLDVDGVFWIRKDEKWWYEQGTKTYYTANTIMQFAPFTYQEKQ